MSQVNTNLLCNITSPRAFEFSLTLDISEQTSHYHISPDYIMHLVRMDILTKTLEDTGSQVFHINIHASFYSDHGLCQTNSNSHRCSHYYVTKPKS